jgi:hypothetical protein
MSPLQESVFFGCGVISRNQNVLSFTNRKSYLDGKSFCICLVDR